MGDDERDCAPNRSLKEWYQHISYPQVEASTQVRYNHSYDSSAQETSLPPDNNMKAPPPSFVRDPLEVVANNRLNEITPPLSAPSPGAQTLTMGGGERDSVSVSVSAFECECECGCECKCECTCECGCECKWEKERVCVRE